MPEEGSAQRYRRQSHSTATNNYRHHSVWDFVLDSRFLIVFLPGTAFILIFVVIPSFLSFITQIFKPYVDVKKNWGSLNLVIVFFAIICGLLPRRTTSDDSGHGTIGGGGGGGSGYGFPTVYPQQVPVETVEVEEVVGVEEGKEDKSVVEENHAPQRNYHGYHINIHNHHHHNHSYHLRRCRIHLRRGRPKGSHPSFPAPEASYYQPEPATTSIPEYSDTQYTNDPRTRPSIDMSVLREPEIPPPREIPLPKAPPAPTQGTESPTLLSLGIPAQPPQSLQGRRIKEREERRITQSIKRKKRELEKLKSQLASITTPPSVSHPPPPPPPPPPNFLQKFFRIGNNQNSEASAASQTQIPSTITTESPPSTPPPPPPPPPKSFLQQFFNRGTSTTTELPPPSPPPLASMPEDVELPAPEATESSQTNSALNQGKPPIPTTKNTRKKEIYLTFGNQSPVAGIQPPPQPPFPMPGMKFTARGHLVRIQSSSVQGSSSDFMEEQPSTPSYLSSDVNNKFNNFITTFRDGLQLANNNSVVSDASSSSTTAIPYYPRQPDATS